MPSSAVLQVSPHFVGMARVSVPVVTISPAEIGGLIASRAGAPTRRRSAETKSAGNVLGMAAVYPAAVAKKIDREGGQRAPPFRSVQANLMSRPHQ
jgi:hypothetical protein